MQLDEPNATIVLDTRRAITSGEHKGKYPVKLRVTFQVLKEGKTSWLQKYYATGFYLDETEYRNAISEKPSRTLRDASDAFVDAKAKAKKIIKDFPSINADLFTLYYTGKAIRSAEVDKLFSLHIENFRSNGQIKSADSYESTRQSLTKFSPGNLVLNVIDKDFLDRYEKWMLSNGFSKGKSDNRNKRGTSIATIGIYMRNLRAVFNYAIRQKIVSQDIYPFGKHGYRIPEGDSIKKALNADERDLYFKYVPENEYQERALDFWKLSYYLNGVNPIDIAYLTEANIQGDVLYYVRSKTKNTERVQSVMAVPLRQEVKDIIAKWGIYKPYLFGIITPEMDALKKRRTVEDFVKRTNKQLNIIRKKLGLGKITTYTARHTAATTYLRLGADLKTIQEFLGHSSISTTEAYLKSIDMEGKKKLNQLL